MQRESIVITGVGLATSLGTSAEETWAGVFTSRDSLNEMPALESPAPIRADGRSKGGYQAAELPNDFATGLPREVRYLRWVIEQAVKQSQATAVDPRRCGIVLGTTLHGMRSGGEYLRTGNLALLSDFLAGSTLQRAMESLNFTGDALTTCSACSSSLGSVALAMTLLESRQLDLVICGGYDATSEYAYAGFNSLRLVADDRLRPFAKDRAGMKLGEGYGVLVLERQDDASQRGAITLAHVLGFGESSDAHHLTQPHPTGAGAAAAVRVAIEQSNISTDDIGLICAHATGTPDNDAGEHAAYAAVFGDRLSSTAIVGLKSHFGHTLGGAGAVELIMAVFAVREQQIPPTANMTPDSLEYPDLHMSNRPRSATIKATLNTSLGFGGANTCVVLGRSPVLHSQLTKSRNVFISGIGVVLPGAVGNEALIQLLNSPPPERVADGHAIPESEYLHLLNARRVRRLSEYVKLTLAAAALAVADAGVNGDVQFAATCSAILGSTHAGANYCVEYYKQIVQDGMLAANPMLFAEGVPNAAAAHLSMTLALKGSCQTILGTRTAGLDALRLAYLRITTGCWDRAIVSAAEEYTPLAGEAYAACRGSMATEGKLSIGSGAVTMVLESEASLASRGGRARGQITAAIGGRHRPDHAVADIADCIKRAKPNTPIIGSGRSNDGWLDRLECDAAARADALLRGSSSDYFPELFSVGPLATIAGALLMTSPATTVLCTGFSGTVAAASITAGQSHSDIRALVPSPGTPGEG